jgi:hypothetical protein
MATVDKHPAASVTPQPNQAEFQKSLRIHKFLLIVSTVSSIFLSAWLGYRLRSIEHGLTALSDPKTTAAADNRARAQNPCFEVSAPPTTTQNSQEPADLPANPKLPVVKGPSDPQPKGTKDRAKPTTPN